MYVCMYVCMYVGGAHADGADDPGERATPFHCVPSLRFPVSAEALHGHGLRSGTTPHTYIHTYVT